MKSGAGFTLIELVIYLSITMVSIFVFTNFVAEVIKNSARADAKIEIQQNARLISSLLTREVRNASSINALNSKFGVDDGKLALINVSGSTSEFVLESGTVLFNDGTGQVALSNAKVKVVKLSFSQEGQVITLDLVLASQNPSINISMENQMEFITSFTPRAGAYQ
ncbi:MAG: hypothetical protein WCT08_04020 [Patescibacteria group bacterium]